MGTLLLQGCASSKTDDFLRDSLLRANPAILPREMEEKKIFDNSNPELIKWDISVCRKKNQLASMEKYTFDLAYIEIMASSEGVPYVGFTATSDINYTSKKGLYLSFSILTGFLKSPKQRPDELISTTSNYFNCLNDSRQNKIDCKKCQSIDLRNTKIISDDLIYHPKKFVHRPTKDGILIDTPPVLIDMQEIYEFSREIRIVLFFEIASRPIRFKLFPPTLYFNEIKVPLPICFFEPFNYLEGKWA